MEASKHCPDITSYEFDYPCGIQCTGGYGNRLNYNEWNEYIYTSSKLDHIDPTVIGNENGIRIKCKEYLGIIPKTYCTSCPAGYIDVGDTVREHDYGSYYNKYRLCMRDWDAAMDNDDVTMIDDSYSVPYVEALIGKQMNRDEFMNNFLKGKGFYHDFCLDPASQNLTRVSANEKDKTWIIFVIFAIVIVIVFAFFFFRS